MNCRLCGEPDHAGRACRVWCRDCGAELVRDVDRYAYRHPTPSSDHWPRPTTRKPEAVG